MYMFKYFSLFFKFYFVNLHGFIFSFLIFKVTQNRKKNQLSFFTLYMNKRGNFMS